MDRVRLSVVLEEADHASLELSHLAARAGIGRLRDVLAQAGRLSKHHDEDEFARFPGQPQVWSHSATDLRLPHGLFFRCLPHRALVEFKARFTDKDQTHTIFGWLSLMQARALLFDLERALADLETFGEDHLWP